MYQLFVEILRVSSLKEHLHTVVKLQTFSRQHLRTHMDHYAV